MKELWEELCEIEGIKFYDTPEMGIACPVSEINRAITGEAERNNFKRGMLDYEHIKEAFRADSPCNNLDPCLNQGCDTIQSHRKEHPMAKRKRKTFTPEFKAKVVLEALHKDTSQAELCQRHNISEEQLSEWKQQLLENATSLFESRDKPSKADAKRIAALEQHIGRLAVALDIQKKALNLIDEMGLKNDK